MATAIQLITDSLYLSEVSALEFETPDDTKISVGLRLLNGILSQTAVDGSMIPYDEFKIFDTEVGEPKYSVDGLVQLETFAFIMNGDVRFPTKLQSNYEYFGSARAENVNAPPVNYYIRRRLGGSDILLYPKPDQVYEMQMYGKFAFTNAAINDNLDDSYDGFYQEWLKYKLASRLCHQYNLELNPSAEAELKKMTSDIFQLVGIDLTVVKTPLVSRRGMTDFWWNANFGKNWIP